MKQNFLLRALTKVYFLYLPYTKCKFLHDLANKTMICYTISVRPTIPESENLKIAMKNIDEDESEDISEEKYIIFEALVFGEKKMHFENCFRW